MLSQLRGAIVIDRNVSEYLGPALACAAFVTVAVFLFFMFRARRQAAAEMVHSLETRGWRNFRSTLWTTVAGSAYRADLEARSVKVEFGIQKKGDPMSLRVRFATQLEDSFEVRASTSGVDNIFTRPLFAGPATTILGGVLQVRGQMSQGLMSSGKTLESFRAALATPHDFVAVRRRKVIISLALPDRPQPGRSFAFRLGPPARQIEERVEAVDHVARSLISAGV